MKIRSSGIKEKVAFGLISLLLIISGFLRGLNSYNISFDFLIVGVKILLIDAAASAISFTIFLALSGLIYFKNNLRSKGGSDRSSHSIACVIPVYQDSKVLENSVNSIISSSYEDLSVKIVCEEDDRESIEEAKELSERNSSAVKEEAPHKISDWWNQRKRWMTGYFQVFFKNCKKIRNLQGYRNILSCLISATSIAGSLLMLTLISKFLILLLLSAEAFYMIPILILLFISVLGRVIDKRRGYVDSVGFDWFLTPLIFPFFSLITVKALIESVSRDSGQWYRVEKRS